MTRAVMQQALDALESVMDSHTPQRARAIGALREALAQTDEAPEGCTPADAMVLREANHALAVELHEAKAALARQSESAAPSWIDLERAASEIVRGKPTWKRHIDGTPLANDIAVWMADFALGYAAPIPAAPVALEFILPPLPEPAERERVYGGHGNELVHESYTKHQMRDYARQAVYAAPQPAPVAQPLTKYPDAALAWDEGYRAGINDERTSEANIGIAGFGAKVQPARNNPYRVSNKIGGPL